MSIIVPQKKRGRPPTGETPHVTVRLADQLITAVDDWAGAHEISRSEAIRQLVELGLKHVQPKKAARSERTWLGRRRFEERETMTQDEARRLVLADWRALPEKKRGSNTDRLLFAMKAAEKYLFKCSGEPYQTVMSWLEHETPGKGRR
jgi:Arc/MetJ-type ribon-helix-helix transcriptional regulator